MVLYIIGIIFAVIIVNYLFNEWEEYKSRKGNRSSEDLPDIGDRKGEYGSSENPYDSFGHDDDFYKNKNNSSEKTDPNMHVSEKEWKVPAFLRKKYK